MTVARKGGVEVRLIGYAEHEGQRRTPSMWLRVTGRLFGSFRQIRRGCLKGRGYGIQLPCEAASSLASRKYTARADST
jgi:hypothetical protein